MECLSWSLSHCSLSDLLLYYCNDCKLNMPGSSSVFLMRAEGRLTATTARYSLSLIIPLSSSLLIKLISHIPSQSELYTYSLVEFCSLSGTVTPYSKTQLIEIADKFERFVFTEVFCAFDNRSLHTSCSTVSYIVKHVQVGGSFQLVNKVNVIQY